MRKLLVSLLILMSINVMSQKTVIPDDRKLIADETEVVSSGDKKFRVITSNEEVSSLIEKKYKEDKVVSINMWKKTDRKHEKYWEVSYYFLNDDYDDVMTYIGIISNKPKKPK